MISDQIIFAEIAVNFFGHKVARIGVGAHAVKDYVQIIGKFFDFRLIVVNAAVFDGERVKTKNLI